MRATLNDIAKKVGVSKSLVSMYLNNHRLSCKIATETKNKIDLAVKELDYKPSFTARALSNGKTKTIGIICGGIKNPYFANLVEDALEEAAKHGYQLLLGLTRWIPKEEEKAVENLLNRQIDGLICCIHPEENSRTYELFRKSQIPIVRMCPSSDFPGVFADVRQAMNDAVAFLASRGHSSVNGIFYRYSEWPEAFAEACKNFHVEPVLYTKLCQWEAECIKLFQRHEHTALIVNGIPPLLAVQECCPECRPDIIVGCDDYTMYPSLDRIAGGIYTDSQAQIRKAVDLLIGKLERPSIELPMKTTFCSRFLTRDEFLAKQKCCYGVLAPFSITKQRKDQ